jgi:hypothetical protein
MKKSVPIKMNVVKPSMDAWVKERTVDVPEAPATVVAIAEAAPEAAAEPMKRFTIDVAEGLHKRIKAQCAMSGTKMADVIREMLEERFPANAA